MDSIPSIWRTEVLHALSVHLPLIALTLATFLFISSFLIKQSWVKPASQFLLIIGTIGAWIAVFTGDAADGIVSRELCDPRVLKDHENTALTTSFLFSAASLITIVQLVWIKERFNILFRGLNLILMIVGTSFLLYVGHLGASLVYQQGAGTFQPSEDCSEFSDEL